MAFISIMQPAQASVPVSEQMSLLIHAWLVIGLLGIALTLLSVFKPNLASLWRAAVARKRPYSSHHAGQGDRGSGARP